MAKEPEKLTGLKLLRAPFAPHQISTLPKPYKKDSPKGKCNVCGGWHGLPAVHLDYVGHAALTDRLLECDEKWTWEPMALDAEGLPLRDREGGLWIKLTVCGVTRLGYGDASGKTGTNAVKELIGDALRNAAMRFGAALDLWHKGDNLHADKDWDHLGGGDNGPAETEQSQGGSTSLLSPNTQFIHATAPDPLLTDSGFTRALTEAFDDTHWSDEARSQTISATCRKAKVQRITDLPLDKRKKLIEIIRDGSLKAGASSRETEQAAA